MKTMAALLREQPGAWDVTEVDLDSPEYGEVLVEMVATGLCHSDDHFPTGDMPAANLPICGGHEGTAIVREVGDGVVGLREGDHIITSFIPACGRCGPCAAGRQNLCDNGAISGRGVQMDGTYRMHADGVDVSTMAAVGTFSQWQILDQLACIKVADDLPLDVMCLLACGVPTGWGSATQAAGIRSGDVVVVMGCGGIGINAVQGAAHVGAGHVIAVDPVAMKREMALKLGATDAYATLDEALGTIAHLTNGQGAAVVIIAIGVTGPGHVAAALSAIRKGGTVVVAGIGKRDMTSLPINLVDLTLFEKRLQGALYGSAAPRAIVPELIGLYRSGKLKLEELITSRYRLEDINAAYDDMRSGKNVRGIIEFGHK